MKKNSGRVRDQALVDKSLPSCRFTVLDWKDKCGKEVCFRTWSAGPDVNAVSVIELCYNYPEEIILTYSLCVRKTLVHNSFAREDVGAGWHSLLLSLSPVSFSCIVLLKYDGSIFILSQWQLMGLFSCGPGGWWNSKQTFFLRRRRVLHHCGWGRHRRLCCVAITAGYGYNTLGLLLPVQRAYTQSLRLSSFGIIVRGSHHLQAIKCSLLGEFKVFVFSSDFGSYFYIVGSLNFFCTVGFAGLQKGDIKFF